MGSVMGKMDPNATNDVDANGNIVATGTPGAKTVADPNQGLSGGQMFVRKALSNSLAGAGNAMQQQGGMRAAPVNFAAFNRQPATPVQGPVINPAQPPVPPQNTGTTPPNNNPQSGMSAGLNGSNNPFPRGPRQSLFYGAPGGY